MFDRCVTPCKNLHSVRFVGLVLSGEEICFYFFTWCTVSTRENIYIRVCHEKFVNGHLLINYSRIRVGITSELPL